MGEYSFDEVVGLGVGVYQKHVYLTVIPEDHRFTHASLWFRVLKLQGGGNAFVEVSLQVGDGFNWAPWLVISDIVKEGEERHGELFRPCHPKFNKLRLRIAKREGVEKEFWI